MNRIKIGPQGTLTQPGNSKFEPGFSEAIGFSQKPGFADVTVNHGFDLHSQTGESFVEDRAIFVPMHYEQNYSYPLIVWLHDNGQDEHGLPEIMFSVSERNFIGVSPRGPETNWNGGFAWPQTSLSVHQSHTAVVAAIDEVRCRFNVSTARIYLGGVGAGGTMAFRLACREPELFAGVISLNGQFPEQHKPLARLNSCRNLPVLWSHARQSSLFTEDQLCSQLRLLHVGGFAVTLRQYPCGDELMAQAFNDVNVWIMDAVNGTDELASRVQDS